VARILSLTWFVYEPCQRTRTLKASDYDKEVKCENDT
jgi:hypothetical protein